MDKDSLLQRKAAIEDRHKQLMDELKRLEGEHRLIVDLLQDPEPVKPQRIKQVKELTNAEN